MFLLLTWVLLSLLTLGIIYYLLVKVLPSTNLARVIGVILFILIISAFFNPNNELAFSASSLLSFPLRPLGLSILLLILGLGQIKSTTGYRQILAALLILILFSMPVFVSWLADSMERGAIQLEQQRRNVCRDVCPDTATSAAPLPDAIVLLGQGTTQANLPYRRQVQLTSTGSRILYTAELYQQQRQLGNDPVVIVSAGPRTELETGRNNINEANDIAAIVTRMGVPPDQIEIDPGGLDFRTSAENVKQILGRRRVGDRVMLVTSAINIRRATLTFENLGIKVTPRPTDFYTIQSNAVPRRRLRVPEDILPNVETLLISTRLVDEFFASIYYFLRGWISPIVF